MNNLGQHEWMDLIKAAGVRWIKFHGMRHTCATLLLTGDRQRGIDPTPVHIVAERLGHKNVSETLETYAHCLPNMQRSAARALASLLYGAR